MSKRPGNPADTNPAELSRARPEHEETEEEPEKSNEHEQKASGSAAATGSQSCGICLADGDFNITVQCCNKTLCHECLCKCFFLDVDKCPFCKQTYLSDKQTVILVRYENRCKTCAGPVGWLLKTCKGSDCIGAQPFVSAFDWDKLAERSKNSYLAQRHLIRKFSLRDQETRQVQIVPQAFLSFGNGPTVDIDILSLNDDGTVCYNMYPDNSTVDALQTWSSFKPLWYPLMPSTLALYKPV